MSDPTQRDGTPASPEQAHAPAQPLRHKPCRCRLTPSSDTPDPVNHTAQDQSGLMFTGDAVIDLYGEWV